MLKIVDKAQSRSRKLARQAKDELEREVDTLVYHQMRKLEHKAKFIREFWQSYELERRDMQMAKEELLAERVALSVLRSGEVRGTPAEKVLSGNEFSTLTSTLRAVEQ
jgi:vacuolar-type H+-ATPase subunit H